MKNFSAALQARAEKSKQQNNAIDLLLPKEFPYSTRKTLARCAISLALQHHSAVVALVIGGHFPSAQAMLRPLMEAGAIAYWLLYSAPSDWVKRMEGAPLEGARNGADTPTLSKLIPSLSKYRDSRNKPLQGIKRLQSVMQEPESQWLNKYTHGGIPQLRRQGTDTPPFSDADMLVALVRADTFLLIGCAAATTIYLTEDVNEINILETYVVAHRQSLYDEMQLAFGTDMQFEPWERLPSPTVDDWDIKS